METSECHELPAAKSAQHGCEGPPPQLRASPIAALVRQGAQTASLRQGSKRASTMVQRMINSLQWRQAHSKDEFYPLALESGAELRLRQLQAGEMTGLGTGATVWPAAHVLAKYLERRYGEDGMKGLRVVDLGSGTGVAGIAAAALGAAESFLTDQEQLLFLMRENAERCARDRDICADAIRVLVYDWGMSDEGLSPPVDVILISDCVLPKLYSIEPLVDAIDKLSGPETVTIMSYEHRYYPAFDPRRRFDEVAISRGLAKVTIPQVQQHPIFFADDIEIWEVRRIQKITSLSNDDKQGNSFIKAIDETRTAKDTTDWTSLVDVVVVSPSPSDQGVTVVKLQGEQHKLSQSLSGAIGCYLWPSSVIMARHLLTAAFESPTVTSTTSSIGDGGEFSRPCPSYPRRANMLEFGSGVGLVAMAAALMGWNVVATDRTDVLPLLKINIDRCLSSTTRECVTKAATTTPRSAHVFITCY